MSAIPELICSVDIHVGQIILNRPASHNAINRQMWDQLPLALGRLKEQGARVVLITGAGLSFAAGADLLELERLSDYPQARDHWFSIRDCLEYISWFELITIAKINGPAIGGGCLLAMACDLRYASDNATFGVPVARLGIVLDDRNISRLVNLVGPAAAAQLLYTADTVSSAKALSIGLINERWKSEELDDKVMRVAEQICENAPGSLLQAKLSINRKLALPGQVIPQDERVVVGSYTDAEFRARVKRQNKP